MCISYAAQAQNKLFVDATATGNNNGSSWNNAYTSLAMAIKHIDTANQIDTLLIARGIYKPEYNYHDTPTSNKTTSFVLTRGNIAIIGGYASGGGSLNPAINTTILSGNIGNFYDSTDNSNKIMYIIGTNRQNTIDHIFVHNLTFQESYGFNTIGWVYENINGYSLNASIGGGLAVHNANVTVDNCIFQRNHNHQTGSGLGQEYGHIIINNCKFDNNNSKHSGGAVGLLWGTFEVTNSTFSKNTTLYFSDVFTANNASKGHFENNTIINNTGKSTNIISFIGSDSLTISNNQFINNSTNRLNPPQYSIENSILYNGNSINTVFNNNTIINCGAMFTMFDQYENTTITNNFLFQNDVNRNINYYLNNRTKPLQNNYFHLDSSFAENINGYLDPNIIILDSSGNNFSYRLSFCSPLVNAGNNTYNQSAYDINGNPRIIDARIDIGAIEKQSDSIMTNNATLTNTQDNNLALIPVCEQDEWTYYSPISNPDSITFAIMWDSTHNNAKNAAKVYINYADEPTLKSNQINKGIGVIQRTWYIDTDTFEITTPVAIRFFHSNNDIQALNQKFVALNYDSLLTLEWFTTRNHFRPNIHTNYETINNGNYNTVTSAVTNVNNNVQYVQFNNLSYLGSGSAFIKGFKSSTSINEFPKNDVIKISPNPTTSMLNIQVLNQAFIGQKASLVNIHGRILHSFELKANNQVDCSQLATGVYLIQVGSHNAAKFVKQ